tara:strand:+ start:308 stop:823 length:516 start_codon:yes stop_codon:yes gene_type:complete
MLDQKVFKAGYGVSINNEIATSEKGDCAVRAFANAFEISYNTAHEFAKNVFKRKNRQGTFNVNPILKGMNEVTFKAEGQLDLFAPVMENKFNIRHLGDRPKDGGTLQNESYTHKAVAYTVKSFMQKFTRGTYFIIVHKHALVIKDGVLIDNGNYRFDGYRRPVESAFKITK